MLYLRIVGLNDNRETQKKKLELQHEYSHLETERAKRGIRHDYQGSASPRPAPDRWRHLPDQLPLWERLRELQQSEHQKFQLFG